MRRVLFLSCILAACQSPTTPEGIKCAGTPAPPIFSVFPIGSDGKRYETEWKNRWQIPHRTADTLDGVIISKFDDEERTIPACLTLADSVVMHMPVEFWRP